jgi:chromosome segregation ATPase
VKEHYLIQQHQEAATKVVHQMRSQLINTQMDTDLPPTTTTAAASKPVTTQLQDVYEIVNILSGGIETLNDDQQRLSNESLQIQIQLQTLTEDFPQIKSSEEESHSFLKGVEHNQNILSQDLSSLKEKINDMQYVSYDGAFVWKITNFKEKMGRVENY